MATIITETLCKIASLRPANTNEQALYLVPASTELTSFLRVCNQDSVARTYSVAHCSDTGAASDDEWIRKTFPIAPYDTHEISILANAAEEIRVQASVADKISFHLSGCKKVTS